MDKLLLLPLLIFACGSKVDLVRDQPNPTEIKYVQLTPSTSIHQFGFGSCFVPQYEDHSIWNTIAAAKPQLFLFIGDNVYQTEEKSLPELQELREAYVMLAESVPFQGLIQDVPLLPTWDDHDYGLNDAGGTWPHKTISEKLFLQTFDIPDDDPRWHRPGIYFEQTVGPQGERVQFIVLDTRFFRSDLTPADVKGPGKERYMQAFEDDLTMLGDEQWTWLQEQLAKPAELRFVASSVQVLASGHGFECWNLFPKERQRFLDELANRNGGQTIILSGDRHMGGIYRIEEKDNWIYELTSSSLNKPIEGDEAIKKYTRETGPLRIGNMIHQANFGWIEIDWDFEVVSLQLRDAKGKVLQANVVGF